MRLAAGAWSSIPTSAGRGAQRCEPWVPRTGRARPWLSLLLLGSLWSWGGAGNPAQLGSLLVPSAWGLQAAVLSQLLRCSESKARRRAGPGGGCREGERAVGGAELPAQCCSSTGLGAPWAAWRDGHHRCQLRDAGHGMVPGAPIALCSLPVPRHLWVSADLKCRTASHESEQRHSLPGLATPALPSSASFSQCCFPKRATNPLCPGEQGLLSRAHRYVPCT